MSKNMPIEGASAGWIGVALGLIEAGEDVVLVTVTATKGSSPRDHGTQMLITATDIWQTIGGGAVEFDVMARARKMLGDPAPDIWQRQHFTVILGPDMGQCCGGQMSLLLEKFTAKEAVDLAVLKTATDAGAGLSHPLSAGMALQVYTPALRSEAALFHLPALPRQTPLFIYGAGHVARALVPRLGGLGFEIFLVDIDQSRFPDRLDGAAQMLLAKSPETIALHAPEAAVHLVMTHSHALDEAICLQLLTRGDFAFLGLIGSKTKRARFVSRLGAAGIGPAMLDLLTCPIGIHEINGKSPAHVALSIAAQLAIWQELRDAEA